MKTSIRTLISVVTPTVYATTAVLFAAVCPVSTQADIFEWEWIDPADPSAGKQMSLTPVPDGTGLIAGRHTQLSGYDLTKAYLINTDLFGTKFLATNLSDADLSNANLEHADFTNATLSGAVIDGADIASAIFTSTTDSGFTFAQFQSTHSYRVSRDLRYLELDQNDLSGWDFSHLYMYEAIFRDAVLAGTNFTDTDLTKADMSGADFNGAILTSARLDRTTLTNADFTGAHIAGARLIQVTNYGFTFEQFQSTASYQAGDLRGISLGSLYMPGWDLSGQDLSGANIHSHLVGANLSGANLKNARLESDFENADLTGADMTGAWIGDEVSFASTTDSGFTNEQLQSTAHFQQSLYMRDIDLSQNDLSGWDFTGQEIAYVKFYQSDLTGADLSQAEMRDSDFRETNLTNARLNGTFLSYANMTGADMTGADVAGAIFDRVYGLTFQQIRSTASYQTGDLKGVTLSYLDMTGWDLNGKDMTGAYLGYSNLNNAGLRSSNLRDVEFWGATAVGADFRNADLKGAAFDGLDATNADFSGADLSDTKLTRTRLTGANMSGAVIKGAYLINATGYGLTYEQFQSTASYQTGDLNGIRFNNNDLTGWDLSGQSLVGSLFKNTAMAGINLSGADLSGARLQYLDLKDINLAGAILDDADVEGTSFRSTTDSGFTFEQLQSTANYQAGRLEGVDLSYNDMTSWNFSSMYMPGSCFESSTLVNANLNEAIFEGINIRGVDITNASIQGTRLSGGTDHGLTFDMFSSTRSYRENDLGVVWLGYNDLTGWRFAGLDLYKSYFKNSVLTDADFSGANLMRADFEDALLDGADMTGADTRRANSLNLADNTITRNLIHPDGRINGLTLGPNESMRITDTLYDYDRVPIHIHQAFTLDPTSTLHLVRADKVWDSIITFEADIPIMLAGTLELTANPSLDPLSLVGIKLQLFDWTGVTPQGSFDTIIGSPGPHMFWDTSQLYTQGTVTAVHIADLNGDRFIGLDDLDLILRHWNQTVPPASSQADPSGDGYVGTDDLMLLLEAWNSGQRDATDGLVRPVPEPITAVLLGLMLGTKLYRTR